MVSMSKTVVKRMVNTYDLLMFAQTQYGLGYNTLFSEQA